MSLKQLAQQIRAQGRGPDTELVHMTKGEVAGLRALAEAAGTPLTHNPKTGLPEASVLKSMLPTLLGIGANFIVPGSGMLVGGLAGGLLNKQNPLMGAALGAMGGSGGEALAQGVTQAGANAAANTAGQAIGQAGQQVAEQGAQQAGQQVASQAAQMLPTTNIPSMTAAERFGAFKEGIGSLGSQEGLQNFVGSAAQGTEGATGMGGIGGLGMAVGRAAAPMALYTPEMDGGDNGEWTGSKFSFNRRYTGGTGGSGSSERRYFDDSFTRLAEGGEVAPRSGTDAGNMTGASRMAFEYLMGRSAAQPVQQPSVAPPVQMPPYTPTPRGSGEQNFFTRTVPGIVGSTRGNQMYDRQAYAQGGTVRLASGGFVIPADVVSAVGAGSSNAGMEALAKHLGATPISGDGDGQSDSIPAVIDGRTPARVARDEMHLTPDQVAAIGGGDASKGAQKLYAMMDRVRKQAMGHTKQIKPVNIQRALR